jgi:tight adherence protein B
MFALILAGGVFALIFGLSLVFVMGRSEQTEREHVLERRMAYPSEPEPAREIMREGRSRLKSSELFMTLYALRPLKLLERNLSQAGLYARVSDILLMMVLLFGGGTAAGNLLWNDFSLSVATGTALALIPVLYVLMVRRRRLKAFSLQLPYALDLLRSALEAGHSLLRSMQVVTDEFTDPLGGEFRTVVEQTRIGMPLARAMEELLGRVPEDDLRLLVIAVKVQAEVGSSLAQIIARLSDLVRTRQRIQGQIRALTAQSRMSGMVVGILPVVMIAAFSFLQPSYTHTLFHDPLGIKIVKTAIVLDAIAFFIIRRMLRLKY